MNTYLIALAIVIFGIFVSFYLARRRKYRDPSAAPNYERIRDKLTLRKDTVKEEVEKDEEDEESHSSPLDNLTSLIMGIVVVAVTVVIGIYVAGTLGETLQTTIAQNTSTYSAAGNVTSQMAIMLPLLSGWFPIFVMVMVGIIVISIVSRVFYGNSEVSVEQENEAKSNKNINHYRKTRDKLSRRKPDLTDIMG